MPVDGHPVPGVPFSDSVQLDDSEDTSAAGTGNCVQMPATGALHEKVTIPLPGPPPLLEHAASAATHAATAHDTRAQRAIFDLTARAYQRSSRRKCRGAGARGVPKGRPLQLLVPPEVYVVANFKETQIGEMRPGQPVTVSVDAFAPRMFEGKVDTMAGGTQGRFSLLPSDNAGENFVKVVQRVPVKLRLAATDAVLLPGLSAGVTVTVR